MQTRYNESFLDLMEKLHAVMVKKGEVFRAKAYQKAGEIILAYPGDIESHLVLKGCPGIGPTIMEKLGEFVETGTLQFLEREKQNPLHVLGDIYGVGPKKAQEWIDAGITTLDQLRKADTLSLTDAQRVGLTFYEDILQRIPRAEIVAYEKVFRQVFSCGSMEIVGSYRRGAAHSGDIDVITTDKACQTGIDSLVAKGIILHVLSRGDSKCLVVARLPGYTVARRVDFLFTPEKEFPFALLYFTGSKYFNTMMRHVALEHGYTMNEHGMYVMKPDKKKGALVNYVFTCEKDIFDFLDLVYKTPEERVDGRAIQSTMAMANKKTGTTATTATTVTTATTEKNKTKKNRSPVQSAYLCSTFVSQGTSALDAYNEKELEGMLTFAKDAYYNKESPVMSDNAFDILEQYCETRFTKKGVKKTVGATPVSFKVALPCYMGSMNKIKPETGALAEWTAKYNHGGYVLSYKLDGVSGLYVSASQKLYTRGDGSCGQDISAWIPHLRLPVDVNGKGDFVIRGEFIMKKTVFAEKYKGTFANPRNMVAGLLNRLTVDPEKAADVDFVAYEVVKPVLSPSEQIRFLIQLGSSGSSSNCVKVVPHWFCKSLTNDLLSQSLLQARGNKDYEIDGIIVAHNSIYPRVEGKNPDHAFAFKMLLQDQKAEAKVVDVIWTPSKDGYLKPRVQIEPIQLGGVQIEYATGFNGAFILQNAIGVGALIEIVRSGDVIPTIQKVVVPAMEPKMPSVPYVWNDSKVDVLLVDLEDDATVQVKIMTAFFRGIGVDGLSSGNVARLMEGGYDSIAKMIKMKVEDLVVLPGFKGKLATKIVEGIREKVDAASLVTLMAHSHCLGRGISEKKIESIMEAYPDILLSTDSFAKKANQLSLVKGIAGATTELFVSRIPTFLQFMEDCGLEYKLFALVAAATPDSSSHPLHGKTVVFTGFRDNALQNVLKSMGCTVGSTVSKNTFRLVIKEDGEDGGKKVSDAKKMGVVVMTLDAFLSTFIKSGAKPIIPLL